MVGALVEHFDLFLHDAQGHGDSDHGGAFVGWTRSAELALQAWNACGEQHFHERPALFGCGHSFGAILTWLMADRSPQLFNQLLLLDPILFPRSMVALMRALDGLGLYRHMPLVRRARRRRASWPTAADATLSLTDRGMFRGWHTDALDAYVLHAMGEESDEQWTLKCSPSREAEVFGSYATNIWRILPAHPVPANLLVGEQTYPFVRRAVTRASQRNDRISVAWQPGGHCFMQEDPQGTAKWLKAQVCSSMSLAG